jgi:hypothetical protein
MKKLIAAAIALVALTGPVLAQVVDSPMVQEEKAKKRDAEGVDKQYKATLQRTNQGLATPARVDPWQNMRGADDSKTKR